MSRIGKTIERGVEAVAKKIDQAVTGKDDFSKTLSPRAKAQFDEWQHRQRPHTSIVDDLFHQYFQ